MIHHGPSENRGGLAIHLLHLVAASFVLAGVFFCGRGAIAALGEINAIYQGATDDALATPEVTEEERSGRVLGHAKVAALGLVPLAAGSLLFAFAGAIRKRAPRREFGDRDVLHTDRS